MKTQALLAFTFPSSSALLSKLLGILLILSVIGYSGSTYAATKVPGAPFVAEHAIKSVNINRADVQTLSAVLKGVGKKRAQAIVDWREKNGPFTDINQLLEVKGIGNKILADNNGKIEL